MTPEELDDLLCQYGAQLRAWPVEHQRAVTALLRASPQARERVREMRRLEAMIADDAPELEPPPGMLERVERTLMGAALKDWKPPAPASARGASASVFFWVFRGGTRPAGIVRRRQQRHGSDPTRPRAAAGPRTPSRLIPDAPGRPRPALSPLAGRWNAPSRPVAP
ncbi:hypothetical protein [Nitrospirillum viridazoti]|uniref:hypothetical protein n=1 Tax=Nitrospirillum viridazoti TaxID=3144925 RepID=UPI0005929DD5|nr:hypothetical protein [Nitrospirillum amazonense]